MSEALDYAAMAEKFDAWLPHLAPVGEALLDALQAAEGERILDVAAGTGEPGLTLARRMAGKVTITGTDAAPSMVEVARLKAAREGLRQIEFHAMPAERLDFPDATFDKALCRFGLMFFADAAKALREMRRVLKPGGRLALSVWGPPETNPTMGWYYRAFEGRIPANLLPPRDKITGYGQLGLLESVLGTAGFDKVRIERREVRFRFADFAGFWRLLEASDNLKAQFEALPRAEWPGVRERMADWAAAYTTAAGLEIPHIYLLATAEK